MISLVIGAEDSSIKTEIKFIGDIFRMIAIYFLANLSDNRDGFYRLLIKWRE